MLTTNEIDRVCKELEDTIPDNRYDPIKNKIKFYLENYGTRISKIHKVLIGYSRSGDMFISLYYEPDKFRRLFFDVNGRLFSVMHYQELGDNKLKSLFGLQSKSLYNVNKCSMHKVEL